jgi:hypothetical protein
VLPAVVDAVADSELAVHEQVRHPERRLLRIGWGRWVQHGGAVEDHEIGPQPRPHQAAVKQAEPLGWETGHIADGLRQRE